MKNKHLQPKRALRAALFVLLLSMAGMTKANPVDERTAREVGMKFMNANASTPLRSLDDLQLVTTYNISRGDAAFHIFNTPNGFVIVAADDCATPILGYSDEGQFDMENIPIQLQDYLQGFVEQIQYGIENHLEAKEQTARQWELVRTSGRLNNNRSNRTVEPLLATKWGQDYPYNMYVPNGCPTGCVATAMAQVMKYWEWPVQGTGEHSYQWNGQTLSANFGETIYDWDNMLDNYNYNYYNYNQEQEEAVATLMWHCGVSVNMDYSPNGSGAFITTSSWINYFSYSDELSLDYRPDYSDASWKAKLKDCLNLGRPVYYLGSPDVGVGHAFVCDGYDNDELFHFNWGWSSSGDGYFAIGALNVYSYDFNFFNDAIFNIHPEGETTTYIINVSANSVEGGSVTGGGTFAHGENVTLSATANDGYGFCYWEENGGIASTNPNYSFTANYNRDLVAVFAEPFTVTVSASEGGTAVGGGAYFYGESCAVTAMPNEGYNFANWTANDFVVSVDANYTYNVIGNTLLTAHFVPEGNIEFADANVKAICVANWDTNGDGELSYAEAAAVTSLGEVFRGNTEIISFEELQYFISLTSINKYAFRGCSGLTGSLIIPDRVTSIGNYAFRGCSGLTGSLIIPDRVTSIGNYAFSDCSGLTGSLIISNRVTSIGNYAFRGCSGLTGDLIIPNSVISIGSSAFYYCSGLNAVYYAGDINQWCNIQFGNHTSNPLCYAHNLYIDNELVTELVIPETVTKIKDYVFYGATCLTSLTIPNTVTSIGNSAFDGCSGLTGSLIIPNTVTSIGYRAFDGCSGFTGSLTIPNSVTTIEGSAFYNCSGFTGELVIPNSVTSIGEYAFGNCTGLTSLVLGNSVTTIDIYSFYGCSGLIGNLIIPNSVTSIEYGAFWGCSGLTSIEIPNSVTSIGDYAFYDCSSLNAVYYAGDIHQWCSIQFAGYASNPLTYAHNLFINNELVTELVIPETVTEIKDYVFYGATCLTSLTIPNTVTSIGSSAFYNCSGITGSLTIPNSVISIGGSAFSGCSGFTGSLTIPNSVTSIGSYAFSGCRGLTGSLTIPNSVTSIGGSAFYNCYGLSSMVVLAETPPTVGSNAFYNVPTNIPVYVPCESVEAYQTAEGWNAFPNIMCISSGTISVVADPNEGGEVSGGGMYEGGDFCTVTATPNEGYCFANWTENGHIVSSDSNYSFVVTGESVLTAHFVSDGNIVFADPNVKAICVTNWDTNGDGELSYVEAASVISLGEVFRGNTEITSFEELQYFISLSNIGNVAFYNCSSLTGSLIIPNSVTTIGQSAFSGCSGLIGNLTIPNSVAAIGNWAFKDCSGFAGSLTIPNSVISIGSYAFYNCSGFTGSLTIPNSVTSIGDYAFYSCSGFTGNLTIPNSVTIIGNGAFSGCSGFTGNLTIPNSVSSIKNHTFYNCSGFTGSLTIPNTITSIGNSAFYNCNSLTGELTIPNSVTTIENYAFYNCNSLTGELTIPNSVITIENYAFYGCRGFTGNLTIGNSVTSIGERAFYNCSGLTSMVVLVETPPTVGSNAFYNISTSIPVYVPCQSLETYQTAEGWNAFSNIICICSSGTISVAADPMEGGEVSGAGTYEGGTICTVTATPNEGYCFANWTKNGIVVSFDANYSFVVVSDNLLTAHFVTEGNIMFADSNVKAICVANWDTDGDGELSYAEAAAVTSLGEVFRGNTEVTSFEELQYFISLSTIGSYAFYNCSSLTGSLIIPSAVTSIGNYAFYNCSGFTGDLMIPNSVTSIGNNAFRGCSGFTGNLIIPNSVTLIGNSAFSICTGFTGNLTIPNSVYSIGSWAFYNCSGLSGDLTISNSVTSIGNSAFYGCSGFTGSLTISNSVTSINNSTFYHCSGFTGDLIIPNSVTSIGEDAFLGCSGFSGNLTISNSVTSIGGRAFYGCSGFIGNLTISNTVTLIDFAAFYDCNGFTGNLTIPNSVTTIGGNAFYNCSGFSGSLIIGSSVTEIGSFAFSGCSGLTGSLTIPNSVTSIGSYAFYNCTGLTGSLTIPNSVTSIGHSAFHNCRNLTGTLIIPNSVTLIDQCVFCNCSGLTGSLIIPNSVTSIVYGAFWGCSGLTSLTIPNSVVSIGNLAFSGCSGLTALTVLAETPPTLTYTNAFDDVPKTIPVYVPCGCVEAYQTAAYWNAFTNIQEVCMQTQTIELSAGWNWFSTYIEADDLLQQLEASLGENGQYIESSELLSTEYLDGEWIGDLEEVGIANEQMYLVQTSAACTIQLQGLIANPTNHVITINPEWNWVGYPCSEEMTIAEALSNMVPEDGDRIESMEGYAEYLDGEWIGLETLKPGQGFLYFSNSTLPRTLVFPTNSKSHP